MRRVHVAVRLLALGAMASIGCSSLYWLLYLALPVLAALLVSRDGTERYLGSDGPAAVRVLRRFAQAYAYVWLLTDALPESDARGSVDLSIAVGGKPTPGSALWRLLTSLPALVVLALLSMVAALLWIVGMITILAAERVPGAVAGFIEMMLRYQFRLLAYHLSLVDAYPAIVDSPESQVSRINTI